MTDLSDIERCAAVADETVVTLAGMLKSPKARRKRRYDQQTRIQIEYAVLWCRRIASRIRALNPVPPETAPTVPFGQAKMDATVTLLRELRPIIARTRGSSWKNEVLQKIDALISP